MSDLIFAIPSKGRLKEQAEAYLADCGIELKQTGGSRGYSAEIRQFPGIKVLLLSASEIARGLLEGHFHIGITGEDLLQEYADAFDEQVSLLKALGFGFARMVVAVPNSWIDVETISDLDDVGAAFSFTHGRRMRVATKYLRCSRRFFAEKGLTHYRLVDSAGATEAAPASGSAELIVDITTTGSTLKANHLKILSDGEMLRSEAQLTGSLNANWSDEHLGALQNMVDLIEARQRAKASSLITTNEAPEGLAEKIPDALVMARQIVLPRKEAKFAAIKLSQEGISPIITENPEFLFLKGSETYSNFANRLRKKES